MLWGKVPLVVTAVNFRDLSEHDAHHRVFSLPASVRVGFAGFPDAAQGRFPCFEQSSATGDCQRLFRDDYIDRDDLSWRGPCLAR